MPGKFIPDRMELTMQADRVLESVELLCVGTELLMGQIVNTNASNLAKKLSDLGLYSYYQTVVGDHPGRMADAMRQGLERSDVVLITGGLGPTEDDICMEVAAEVAGEELVFDSDAWDKISLYFTRQGRETTENNRKQALRPKNATSIPNNNGTAPGAIVPVNVKGQTHYLVLLPGPPRENLPMFDEYVAPFLTAHRRHKLRTAFVHFVEIGESSLVTIIKDLIAEQTNPTIAPYASEGRVTLRLTQSIEDDSDEDLISPIIRELDARLGRHIFEIGDRDVYQVLLDHLTATGETLSIAESCTGGRLLSSFIQHPGASDAIEGGLVTYSNRSKVEQLGIPKELIDEYGAVSEEVASAMAEACRARFATTYALSTTGIAGPGGGSDEKPVGTTYIALATPRGSFVIRRVFRGNRDKNRRLAAINAATMLWRYFQEEGTIAFGEELCVEE